MRLTEWIQNIGLIVPHQLRERTDAILIGSEYYESLPDEGITIIAEYLTHTQNALRRIRHGINLIREADQRLLIPLSNQLALKSVQDFLGKCNEPYFKDLKPLKSSALRGNLFAGTYAAEGSKQYDTHYKLWQKLCSEAGLENIPLIVAESDFPFMMVASTIAEPKGVVSSYYLDRLHPHQLESLFLHEIKHLIERKQFKAGDTSLGSPDYTDDMQHNHAKEYRADDHGASNARLAMGGIQRIMWIDSKKRQLSGLKELVKAIVKYNAQQAFIPEIQEKFEALYPPEHAEAKAAIRKAQEGVDDAFDRYSLTHPSMHDRVIRKWQHYHRHIAGSDSRDRER